ncbi:MAG: ATP-binding protein [Bacteroidales bacterium]|nr:ATP-binding protein [Lentimicrobiaceae bacterium]MDD5695546.1 ATP-binding protein [Bacteroidales bacterium]
MIETREIRIAIASGKGGTGKTLVATNLFYSLFTNGIPVTLIDCDAEEPNAKIFFQGELNKTLPVTQKVPVIDVDRCTFCGKCYEYCVYNALFIVPPLKVIQVIEDLCHGCGACSVACQDGAITEKEVQLGKITSYRIHPLARLVEGRTNTGVFSPVPVIKAALREGRTDQIIIMDAPPGTSCPFIQTVVTADYVILVTEPTPFGLSDLRQSIETLRTMYKPFGVIVNRSGIGNRDVYQYLQIENIPFLLEIPFDRTIASLYSSGKLLAREIHHWQEELLALVNTVIAYHGNSCHQR